MRRRNFRCSSRKQKPHSKHWFYPAPECGFLFFIFGFVCVYRQRSVHMCESAFRFYGLKIRSTLPPQLDSAFGGQQSAACCPVFQKSFIAVIRLDYNAFGHTVKKRFVRAHNLDRKPAAFDPSRLLFPYVRHTAPRIFPRLRRWNLPSGKGFPAHRRTCLREFL